MDVVIINLCVSTYLDNPTSLKNIVPTSQTCISILPGTACSVALLFNFLNVYATRLGASGLQIGLLTAMSAVVNLFLAIPAGHWISKRHTGRAVFWAWSSSALAIFYLFPYPGSSRIKDRSGHSSSLPSSMAIPLTPLGVGFDALFLKSVPDHFRARVAGTRNVTFAIAYMFTSFGAGYISRTAFPDGYQIIFAIGAFGAAIELSSFMPHTCPVSTAPLPTPPTIVPPLRGKKTKSPRGITTLLRLDIWNTHFQNLLLALFFLPFRTLSVSAAISALQCKCSQTQ